MTEHHDHRDDCPFKFATLDVCDCVEKNMLDRIEQLVAINEALTAELATCEKYRDAYAECDRIGTQTVRDLEAKLAAAVDWFETIRDRAKGDYMAHTYYLDALAALATIEGGKT
jgi:hypothetical protein